MNVLITSGGTTEKIDAVRNISNISTGKLGSLIADRFADESGIEKIFYICGNTAIKPQIGKAEIIYADNVSSLANAIQEALNHTSIDIIVHGMAVSDYRVRSVTSAAALAGMIVSNIDKIDEVRRLDHQDAIAAVMSLINNAEPVFAKGAGGNGKICSDMEDMLLLMERTPKIISLFQQLSPQSTLVGFKLLDNVPPETLIDRGFQILTQNKCSFVLANDLRDIAAERHIGYLIDRHKNYTRYSGKMEIANAIVSAAINERTNKP